VARNNNVVGIILPFFELYPLYGIKSIQLIKIKHILTLMSYNNHRLMEKPGQPWNPLIKSEIKRIWLYD